ncbi:hypothetical protein HMPREF9554_02913 [Treponema phagedenis F0421]|nr:hypothetical protein HMPREF9554_02913 [Treponema phagedenis F0421]
MLTVVPCRALFINRSFLIFYFFGILEKRLRKLLKISVFRAALKIFTLRKL